MSATTTVKPPAMRAAKGISPIPLERGYLVGGQAEGGKFFVGAFFGGGGSGSGFIVGGLSCCAVGDNDGVCGFFVGSHIAIDTVVVCSGHNVLPYP